MNWCRLGIHRWVYSIVRDESQDSRECERCQKQERFTFIHGWVKVGTFYRGG